MRRVIDNLSETISIEFDPVLKVMTNTKNKIFTHIRCLLIDVNVREEKDSRKSLRTISFNRHIYIRTPVIRPIFIT